MKKTIVALCVLALLGATSCKKNETEPITAAAVPTYTEGIYQPLAQIATISENGALAETWSWSGKNLDHITLSAGGQVSVNYSGNYISKVTNSGSNAEELRYYYTGNAISKCEVYYNNVLAITMDMLHNAAGKLSSAQMTIDDNYLLNMVGGLFGQGFALEKLVGPKVASQMVLMAQLDQRNNSKLSVGSKNFNMTFVWDGDDLRQQITNGSVVINLSSDDMDLIASLMPDEAQSYVQLIQTAMALAGGNLPLNMVINDTVNITHDAYYNPKFCYWGEMVSPENLSLHNVLTEANAGAAKLSVSLMGQTMDLYNYPFDDHSEYSYLYNDKKYPTHVSGSKNLTYTYKQ